MDSSMLYKENKLIHNTSEEFVSKYSLEESTAL